MCINVYSIYGQQSKLLQNYKYRVNKFQAINVDFNTLANKENTYFKFQNPKGRNFTTQIAVDYNRVTITNKNFTNFNVSMGTNYSTSKMQNDVDINKSTSFSLAPQISLQNKWFHNKIYFQFDIAIANSNIYSKQNQSNNAVVDNNKSNGNYIQSNLTLGVGKGRLENITDMQNALWLYKILKEERQLTRDLNEDELNALAQTITNANTRRVLDGRQQRKFILKSIDYYLQSKSVIKKTDMDYFANLNDVVFFANNFPRLSGLEMFVKLIPIASTNKDNAEQFNTPFNKNKYKNDIQTFILKIGFEKYKPLELAQQINYGLELKGTHNKIKENRQSYTGNQINVDNTLLLESNQLVAAYFFQYSIYPNTRTIFNFSFSGENGIEFYNAKSSIYHNVGIGLSADYFISYNTRLNLAIGESYYYSKFNTNQNNIPLGGNLNFSFNCGLKVAM